MKEEERIHFIGIGGTGLSAMARVLHESGRMVSGSDRQASPLADALRADGVIVHIGHRADHVAGATLVVRSSAVPDDNVEVLEARRLGVPVLKRAEFLERLTSGRKTIAVAGTHGKTTTTSMITWVLTSLGLDPTFICGGVIANLGTNARAGKGPHFVIEADEYDHMFLGLRPEVAVITNVEHDHPDLFPTEGAFLEAFEAFADRIVPGGSLVVWADEVASRRMAERVESAGRVVLRYGFGEGARLRGMQPVPHPGAGWSFDVVHTGQLLGTVHLRVPGRHNVLNALAALGVGFRLGLPFPEMAAALGTFQGAGRRFEVRGEAGGVLVVDDYAHHPTEIRTTIEAARARYPDRPLWVVWQPHTFSRVALLQEAFAGAFVGADHVLVTPVYAARETAPAGFSLDALVSEIDHPDVRKTASLEDTVKQLEDSLLSGDVLLVLSAGDADMVGARVLETLSGRVMPAGENGA